MYVSGTNLWLLWVFVLPLGPLLGWWIHGHWTRFGPARRHAGLAFFLVSLGMGLFTLFTRWSFRGFWPQAANLALAYISAACCSAIVFTKSRNSFYLVALRSLAVFVFVLLCYGLSEAYLRTDLPEKETHLGDHLILRQASGGWAGIDWEGVMIVQQPRYLPFLEKRLFSLHIGDEGDCDETSVHITPNNSSHEILIRCGSSDFIYGRVKMP